MSLKWVQWFLAPVKIIVNCDSNPTSKIVRLLAVCRGLCFWLWFQQQGGFIFISFKKLFVVNTRKGGRVNFPKHNYQTKMPFSHKTVLQPPWCIFCALDKNHPSCMVSVYFVHKRFQSAQSRPKPYISTPFKWRACTWRKLLPGIVQLSWVNSASVL